MNNKRYKLTQNYAQKSELTGQTNQEGGLILPFQPYGIQTATNTTPLVSAGYGMMASPMSPRFNVGVGAVPVGMTPFPTMVDNGSQGMSMRVPIDPAGMSVAYQKPHDPRDMSVFGVSPFASQLSQTKKELTEKSEVHMTEKPAEQPIGFYSVMPNLPALPLQSGPPWAGETIGPTVIVNGDKTRHRLEFTSSDSPKTMIVSSENKDTINKIKLPYDTHTLVKSLESKIERLTKSLEDTNKKIAIYTPKISDETITDAERIAHTKLVAEMHKLSEAIVKAKEELEKHKANELVERKDEQKLMKKDTLKEVLQTRLSEEELSEIQIEEKQQSLFTTLFGVPFFW